MIAVSASLLLALGASVPVRVQGEAPMLQRVLSDFQDRNGIPGLCLTVSYGGKLVFSMQRGYANSERKQPFTTSTRIAIGTVSKVPTALATMHLLDAKGISLDSPALRYLKLSDPLARKQVASGAYSKVTFRQLLEHSAGFGPDFNPWSRLEVAKAYHAVLPSSARQNVEFGLRRPLNYTPGSRYQYSNFDYLLLGRLIEDLSGQRYSDYVQASVLRPLGMSRTILRRSRGGQQPADETRYYEQPIGTYPSVFAADAGKSVPLMYGGAAYEEADASAGWLADSLDLARLISAFRTDKIGAILSSKMQMEVIHRPDYAGDVRRYASLGLDVEVSADGGGVSFRHGGDLPGASTTIYSEFDGACVALAMNKGVSGRDLSKEAMEAIGDALTIEDWAKKKPFLSL